MSGFGCGGVVLQRAVFAVLGGWGSGREIGHGVGCHEDYQGAKGGNVEIELIG
jgi:hypothetical protein